MSSYGLSVLSIEGGLWTPRSVLSTALACARRASMARSKAAASVMPVQNGALVAPVCARAVDAPARNDASTTTKRKLRFFMTATRIPPRFLRHDRRPCNAWDESPADRDRCARPAHRAD